MRLPRFSIDGKDNDVEKAESPQLSPRRLPLDVKRSLDLHDDDSEVDDTSVPLLPQHRSNRDFKPSSRSSSPHSSRPSSPPNSPSYGSALRKARRARGIASLSYSTAVLCFVVTVSLSVGIVTWGGLILYQRHNAYATAVFSGPMIPKPVAVEGRVEPFKRWVGTGAEAKENDAIVLGSVADEEEDLSRFGSIQHELDARFDALQLPHSTSLTCASVESDPTLLARYSPLRGVGSSSSTHSRAGPTLFALNLYNSADLLPALSRTLLSIASFLGPSSIHISIFENGSTDNTTVSLAHLAAALTAANVPHTITSDPRKTDWSQVDRIAQLSLYRNVALEPLHQAPYSTTTPPQDIVFINDVYICPRDVLELMFQRKVQEADAACAFDWRSNGGLAKKLNHGVKMYDSWVARSIKGQMLRNRFDVFSDWRDGIKELWDAPGEEYSRDRFQRGLPVPVYSCWNGMLALSATPFISTNISSRYIGAPGAPSSPAVSGENSGLALQREDKPVVFRAALRSEGECAASECKTVARDLWSRGFNRWLVVPNVRVTYDLPTYTHPQLLALSSLNPPASSSLSLTSPPPSPLAASSPFSPLAERIDWHSLTPPSKVVCFDWVRGWSVDFEWWRATLEPPFASLGIVKWIDDHLRR